MQGQRGRHRVCGSSSHLPSLVSISWHIGHTCLAETDKSSKGKRFPNTVAVCWSSMREQCWLGSGSGCHSAWRGGEGAAQPKSQGSGAWAEGR